MRVRCTATLTVGALALLGGVAVADAPTKTGWWNAASANGFSLPQPTSSADSLHVGQGPNGPSAYAALAYDLTGQVVSGAVLQLKVVPNSAVGTVEVTACPTKDAAWKAGGNQPYDTAPAYDCAKGVRGIRATDGKAVTFLLDARQLVGGGYSLAVVPAPAAKPFSVDFAKPDATSLSPEAESGPAADPAPAPAPEPYEPPAASGTSGSAPLGAGPLDQGPGFEVQEPAVTAPLAPEPVAAAPPAAPPVPPSIAGPVAAPAPLEPVSNRDRYAAGTMLALLAGALVYAFQQPSPRPRLIGGMARRAGPVEILADPRPRGIGRFAVPRTASARRLV